MFINDLFSKKQLNESLRDGEYYTYQVFFDDGTTETLNFNSDDIDWDRVGARRNKKVVNVKRQGGIQGSETDTPKKAHQFPDDSFARAQRAYDRQLPEAYDTSPNNREYFDTVQEWAQTVLEMGGEVIKARGVYVAHGWDGEMGEFDPATGEGWLVDRIMREQSVAETSDYSRRREREEAIISGKQPARKRSPAQTSDYAKRREQEKKQGAAEGFPYDVDHMPGPTKKHTSTNCTTCHGRKAMYRLDGKLFADNRQGAVRVKCPTCKGIGDKQGVDEEHQPVPQRPEISIEQRIARMEVQGYEPEQMAHRLGISTGEVISILRDLHNDTDVVEAGPFLYGAKKTRKGTVSANAEAKRKEQHKGKQPIEPKDNMVGVAKVVKDVGDNANKNKKNESSVAENPYLKNLILRHIDEVKKFASTGELDPTGDLFYELYEYYANGLPVAVRQNPARLEKVLTNKVGPLLKHYATTQLNELGPRCSKGNQVKESEQLQSTFKIKFDDGTTDTMYAEHDTNSQPAPGDITFMAKKQNPGRKIKSITKTGVAKIANEDIEKYVNEMSRAGYEIVSEKRDRSPGKISKTEDPCWSGYHMVGKKKNGGRTVPNCVPGKKE